jgi:hypothetical protein
MSYIEEYKRLANTAVLYGAGGRPEGERNGNYRRGSRTKEMAELSHLINSFRDGPRRTVPSGQP